MARPTPHKGLPGLACSHHGTLPRGGLSYSGCRNSVMGARSGDRSAKHAIRPASGGPQGLGPHCGSLTGSPASQGYRFDRSGAGGLGRPHALGGAGARAALTGARSRSVPVRCAIPWRSGLRCTTSVRKQADLRRHTGRRTRELQILRRLEQERVQHRAESCRKPGRVVGLQSRCDGSLRVDGGQRPTQCGTAVDGAHDGQAQPEPGDRRPAAAARPTRPSLSLPGT